MKLKIKATVLTFFLVAAVLTLQNCRKNDRNKTDKRPETREQMIAKLRSTPQIVYKKTVTTLEQLTQMVNNDRNGRIYPLVCSINPHSSVLDYWLTHTGDCSNESYTMTIRFLVWNTYHTDGGPNTFLNPDPALSNVQISINGNTVNADYNDYPYAPNDVPGVWLCVFEFPYSDVGLATQTTSFNVTLTGTFTCANSNTGNVNDTYTSLPINACTADGVVYPQTPSSGFCNFFFPWDIVPCSSQAWLNPSGLCFEIHYRPNGSTGSYTIFSDCGLGPIPINDNAGFYEFKSRYVCSGNPGEWYFGNFTIN